MSNEDDSLSQFDISKEEKDKLVAEVIRYIFFKTHQSSGCPVKREELTQLVTKNYRQRALPAYIIDQANKTLSNVFGYELREFQRIRPSSANQGRASQKNVPDIKSYVLISQLPDEVYKKYVEDVNSSPMAGFTFTVVSIIHLAGGKLPEETLWHHLKRLGLLETIENHPVLGNIKEALETLVQQRYLQKDKVSGPDGTTLYYELAERALDGPISERIKRQISQIVKKDSARVEIG